MRPHSGDPAADVDLIFDGDGDEERPRQRRRPPDRSVRRRHRRNARFSLLLAVALVVVVAAVGVPWAIHHFRVADYSGSGAGSVSVQVNDGDSAADIGSTLHRAGVVASVKAFTNAAEGDSRSQDIQPGTYVLHRHMSAGAALAALLNPASRSAASDVVIPEGATVVDVDAKLVTVLGARHKASVDAALKHPDELGLPLGYATSGQPASAEGFLFPATYPVDPGQTAGDALQAMVARFAAEDRSLGFASTAKAIGLTPYRALIIASIAQAEAKYPADMPKVARVILNRLKAARPLQIDATSAYRAKLAGLDPTRVIYSEVSGPYNTYRHAGLPPTPIDNPGAPALRAAVHPAAGNWLFYVNSDSAGHLFFTADEAAFAKAAARCRAQHWGCG